MKDGRPASLQRDGGDARQLTSLLLRFAALHESVNGYFGGFFAAGQRLTASANRQKPGRRMARPLAG